MARSIRIVLCEYGFDFLKRMFDISIRMLDIEFLILYEFTRAENFKAEKVGKVRELFFVLAELFASQ